MRLATRFLVGVLLCSLTTLGFPVGSTWAVDASAEIINSSTTLKVEGTLVVFANEDSVQNEDVVSLNVDEVRLLTSTGETVEVTGELTMEVKTGSTFAGTLSMSPKSVREIEAELHKDGGAIPIREASGNSQDVVDGESELGRAILSASESADVSLVADEAQITQAVTAPLTAIPHTFDVAVVTLPEDPAASIMSDAAVSVLIDEMSTYWASQSAGQIASISRPDEVVRFVSADACNPYTVWDAAAAQFEHSSSDWYWRSSAAEHLVVIAPESCSNSYIGLGTLGSINRGGVVWASFRTPHNTHTIAHEFGHNLGLHHSGSISCTGKAGEEAPCSTIEYGDYYDIMGIAKLYYDKTGVIRGNQYLPALNVTHKSAIGALNSNDLQSLTLAAAETSSSTDLVLQPASATSGMRGIVATDPYSGEKYFVEYRSGTGIDEGAVYSSNAYSTLAPGVRVLKLAWNGKSTVFTRPMADIGIRAQFLATGQSFQSLAGGVTVSVGQINDVAAVTVYLGDAPPALITSAPSVLAEGTPTVGGTLTADPGVWGPAPVKFAYQWLRDGKPISGETGATIVLTNTDLYARMSVSVAGTKDGYLTESLTSQQSAMVTLGTLKSVQPIIMGIPAAGSLLTAVTGDWEPEPVAFTYQWSRDGMEVPDAVESTYRLTATDVGGQMTVSVSGTKNGYSWTYPRFSTNTAIIEAAPLSLTTVAPQIAGILVRGQVLTVTAEEWGPGMVGLTYAWFRSGVAIDGATRASYTLTPTDEGQTVTVAVTGTKSGYAPQTMTSTATKRIGVKPIPAAPASVSAIAGNAQAIVSWAAPTSDDGSAVSQYTVTSLPGGMSVTSTSTSGVATGLSNGVAYTFTVVATNDVGDSIASAASAAVTPLLPRHLTVTRLDGADRFAASAAISAKNFLPGAPVVYVTNGFKFPDALSAAPVAGNANAPILLIAPGDIDATVDAELRRLQPEEIIVLGGTDSVHASVEKALAVYTTTGKVSRLAGPDRFSASAAISAGSFSAGAPVVYITNGLNFPDALSAAPVAGNKNAPILLVQPTKIPDSIADELSRLKPEKIIVLGGTDSVAGTVATALKAYTSGTVERFTGSDRFAASAAISAGSFDAGAPVVYVANGFNFPDALSAAPVAGHANAPILLVAPGSIPNSIAVELARLRPSRIVVLGGVNSVTPAVKVALQDFTR